MTTADLDRIGRELLEKAGANPAPELCYAFPGATCISVNEETARRHSARIKPPTCTWSVAQGTRRAFR